MPIIRRQPLAHGALPASKRARPAEATEALVACVRPWGSVDLQTPLWQIQFTGGGHRAFTFSMLSAVRDMLEQRGEEGVKTLSEMEATWHVRIITGAPPPSGSLDIDGTGIAEWAPAVYCAGVTPARGLQLIRDTLTCKAGKKPGLEPPPLKGKRHVLAQLEVQPPGEEEEEQQAETEEEKYVLSFFGGIYPFKERFDARRVLGGPVAKDGAEDQKEYVRFLDGLTLRDEQSEERIRIVLEDVLRGMPVFLINSTTRRNGMAAYLLTLGSVVRGEDVDL
ncbi:Uncharacterized protein SCF082_LOCUS461 [Durusdinium trenchii]|uniref:Uncharacterized protein n=1 Tax=Durusdinium trenchii TaxID=1381693 RepID=A0ABP0H810_9DINO